MKRELIVLAYLAGTLAYGGTVDDYIQSLAAQAKKQNPSFDGFSAKRGKNIYFSKLTLNEEDVHIVIEDFEISADLHYMSMALKNLVENALKYTHTLPIEIRASDTCIHIISCAEALDRPLTYYTQPFTRAASDKKGYGLGLNITQKILDRHGFSLHYTHSDGRNDFVICFEHYSSN